MPNVEHINLQDRFVILEDGRTLPISFYCDIDGEETEDPSKVVVMVCGSDTLGWFVIPLFDIFPVKWN